MTHKVINGRTIEFTPAEKARVKNAVQRPGRKREPRKPIEPVTREEFEALKAQVEALSRNR